MFELEESRKQLLNRLMELEKNPNNRRKGFLRQTYFEIFGGVPQDLMEEDLETTARVDTYEAEEEDPSPDLKKSATPKAGFFKSIMNKFKIGSKPEPPSKPETAKGKSVAHKSSSESRHPEAYEQTDRLTSKNVTNTNINIIIQQSKSQKQLPMFLQVNTGNSKSKK